MSIDPKQIGIRQAFYTKIAPYNLTPLWEVLHALITPQPRSKAVPALWRYDDLRPLLFQAGELISAREAERRVLILENPGLRGSSSITTSLYAGLQLVLPGEAAPSHRHTQSALRFVLEGRGAYTTVDGERTLLNVGDFVITPSWAGHDHGNETDDPIIWLDGLDIPLVQLLDASFADGFGGEIQRPTRAIGDSLSRYGNALLPVSHMGKDTLTSPILNYPYARSREALEKLRLSEEWDPCHGLKMCYVNPTNGDFAMPSIGTFLQLLPNAFETAPYRCSDATIYVCVEGAGETVISEQCFRWGPRDVFVVPSWTRHFHRSAEDTVLFSFSDRPVQQKLGLWREERG